MPSKAKQKGSSYERHIAEFLSKTYGEKFLRNLSGSGAFTGGKNSYRKNELPSDMIRHVRGDIIVPESFSNLNCECKSYGKFPFNLLLSSECKQLEVWLEQLVNAGDEKSIHCLFMKITRVGQYIAIEEKYNWKLKNHVIYTSNKYGKWILCQLETFFDLNSSQLKLLSNNNAL